ncbi:conserved hypothetical protein [Bosea sp. 46]|nr:conserved hypothetical protein [Bosea sp. 46]
MLTIANRVEVGMVSRRIALPRDWGRRLMSWLLVAWIAASALTHVPAALADVSGSESAVHVAEGAAENASAQSPSAVHLHACSGATCPSSAPQLSDLSIAVLSDGKAMLHAPDEDGAGLGPSDFERPPRDAAGVST